MSDISTPPPQAVVEGSTNGATNGSNGTEQSSPQTNGTASSINYPPVSKSIDSLSMSERMMKIGRSCPCDEAANTSSLDTMGESGCNCQGWRPKPTTTPGGRVDNCACGHKLSSHGGPFIGEEADRRLKAAARRDELLQDKGKLLDFEYNDEDTTSLRKQILPMSTTSEQALPSPQNLDSSSAAAVADDGRVPELSASQDNNNYRHHSEGRESRIRFMDTIDDSTEREHKRVKMEGIENSEEVLTTRVAENGAEIQVIEEGSSVANQEDTTDPVEGYAMDDEDEVPLKPEKPAVIEEREGLIEFRVVRNDGSRESMILLTGMKNIFQKQLPKMPREYIARLVYDRNHYSMAIVKAPLVVLGGITYRPFNLRHFAEIVFCAITSTEQVKGYGSHLMNHLKDYISEHTDVRHFLTYADNYAIGYFKKQGFTKEITLDRSIWMGYIKDYEGGTIMQCTTVPKVKYLSGNVLLQLQRRDVVSKIKDVTKSHIVYPGLKDFQNGVTGVDPMQVPGIRESGWDPLMDITPRVPVHGPFYSGMKHIVAELTKDASSWPFLHPVDTEAVADYYSYIKDPMDLSTLESNVDADVYKTLDDFAKDCRKIFDNCRMYNGETTPYVKCANKLEKVFKDKLKELKEAA